MRGAGIIRTNLSQWGRGLAALLALMAIALHVFAVQGHAHVAALPQHGAADGAFAHDHKVVGHAIQQSLSNPNSPAPCVFCQTMAAGGPGLVPLMPLFVLFGAAALIAALFRRRQVSLQRLNAWRSRAPPLSA